MSKVILGSYFEDIIEKALANSEIPSSVAEPYYQISLANNFCPDDQRFETRVEAIQSASELNDTANVYAIWKVEDSIADPVHLVWRGALWDIA